MESSLLTEFDEIAESFVQRCDNLDDDLKKILLPFKGNNIVGSKLLELFMSKIYYPELIEFNFISFQDLSNDCMKKILDEVFNLFFTFDDDYRFKLSGKSENSVELKSFYFKPRPSLFMDFLSDTEKQNKKKEEHILPDKGSLVNLIPYMSQLKIKLPTGYFV
jgi:hypothetical protein